MEGYSGIVVYGNMEMPVDEYLKMIKKKKDRERQKQRRGKNNYGFPEEDDDADNSSNQGLDNYSKQTKRFNNDDDDSYSGNTGYSKVQQNYKADPFANAGGPRKSSRRSDPFGNQQQKKSNLQFGATNRSSNGFPRTKGNSLGNYEQENNISSRKQPQKTRGNPFAGQSQQNKFPQSRRKDPFSRNRGFNDDDDY